MKKRKVISLYTGAGGLDFGLEAAGFEVGVAVEMDSFCCKTIRQNRNWALIENKIEDVDSKSLLKRGNLKVREADILVGGPPCQPFSKSSYWVSGDTKRLDDPRANTLSQYMRVLNDTLPKTFLLENVFGLAYKNKDEGLQYLLSEIKAINKRNGVNYSVTWKVINAADYGVPQIRERVFMIGQREGKEFVFPRPRFRARNSEQTPLDSITEPYRTAWDAIGDLNDDGAVTAACAVGGKWSGLLPTIPPGMNYLWHSERGEGKPIFKWRSRYWCFLLKLHPELPSWTIQAQPGSAIGPFHWNNRRLTMREMARVQTFPDDVEIVGGISQVQKQLGNAVPSAIGELLGKEIRRQLFKDSNVDSRLTLIPPKRKGVPKIDYKKSVPRKFVLA